MVPCSTGKSNWHYPQGQCLLRIDEALMPPPPCCLPCRGVALEALGRFEEAVADYRAVLAAEPNDPAAWNNLGNATTGAQEEGLPSPSFHHLAPCSASPPPSGLGKYEEALGYFRPDPYCPPPQAWASMRKLWATSAARPSSPRASPSPRPTWPSPSSSWGSAMRPSRP